MSTMDAFADPPLPDQPAASRRFAFAWAPGHRRASRLFGVTPARAWVDVGDESLDAHFGRWRVLTPLSNITAVKVTGPYRFFKVAGPPHLGVTDLGITFAANSGRGVLLTFREKVPGIEPFGVLRHPELTVTVAEIDAFVQL
ncbi:MAG: hypothetical protein WCB67_16755, partial [Solirubrobacteraceae bacterium]